MARRKAVVVGASSGVGRALAERLAREGFDLVIASRDLRDLECVAADLALRWKAKVSCLALDLADVGFDAEAFRRRCEETLGAPDAVFFPAGEVSAQDEGLATAPLLDRLVKVNFTGPIELVAAFLPHLTRQGRGDVVMFSTIAASAPRRRNMAYASAKAALEFYGRALRHHLVDTGVRVHVYALGYVDTAMSFGQQLKLPVAAPEEVAREVVANLGRDRGVVYYPRFWALVTFALRHLPWFLYRHLKF